MALTPEEVKAQAAGYSMPEGTSRLTNGDDAIRQNAVTSFEARYERGYTANADDARTPGHYYMNASTTNNPFAYNSTLEVSAAGSSVIQTAKKWGNDQQIMMRWIAGNNTTGEWERMDAQFKEFGLTTDANTATGRGRYIVNRQTANLPLDAVAGYLDSVPLSGNYQNEQKLTTWGAAQSVWLRWRDTLGNWGDWSNLGAQGARDNSRSITTDNPATAGVRNPILAQKFSRQYRRSTNGKGAVALRFDHGLENFNTIVRPLLRQYDLPASLVLNSRRWDIPENNGVTAEMVNVWVEAGEVEIWNHFATHSSGSGVPAVTDLIVNGLIELRNQLPAAEIWGCAPPGVGENGYDGLSPYTEPEHWSATIAGQLVLANHAVFTSIPAYTDGDIYRPLDGIIRNGEPYTAMDSQTVTTIKTWVDTAAASVKGVEIMLHPSAINTEGRVTTANVEEVLAHIAAKRDSGELDVLTPYELLASTSVPDDVGRRLAALEEAIAAL